MAHPRRLPRLTARLNPRQRRARQWKKLVRAAAREGELPSMYLAHLRQTRRLADERRAKRRAQARYLRTQLDVHFGTQVIRRDLSHLVEPV